MCAIYSCAHTAIPLSPVTDWEILGPRGPHTSMTSHGWFVPYPCRTGAKEDPSHAESSPSPALSCRLQSIAPLFHHILVFCRAPAMCHGFGSQGLCPRQASCQDKIFSHLNPAAVGSTGSGTGPAGRQECFGCCVAARKTPCAMGAITATTQPALVQVPRLLAAQ